MSELYYRPVQENEIPEASQVFLTSVTEMASRKGLSPPAWTLDATNTVYRHIHRTGIFYVAEMNRRIVSISHAIVRDHLWFLSGFWTLPQFQSQKIGGPLLKKVWKEGEKLGASTFFTWSS